MPKTSRDSLHAKGKTDVYFLDPNDIVLVTDRGALLYDRRAEDPPDEALVANIMYAPDGKSPIGILQPIMGRRNPETGKVEVAAGRSRVIAAREANKRLKKQGRPPINVPVWIRKVSESHLLAALISENERRRADSPLNRAEKMQRYVNLGHGEKETAVMFGVSESTVRNMLLLLDAPAAVRNALEGGKIAASDAYALAREEPAEARKKLGQLLEQAPRIPGKKKQGSERASRARAVLRGPKGKKKRLVPGAKFEPDQRSINHFVKVMLSERALKSVIEQAHTRLIMLGFVSGESRPLLSTEDAEVLEEEARSNAAAAIAAWIEQNWSGGSWDGSPADIPRRIREGEWRTAEEKGHQDGDDAR